MQKKKHATRAVADHERLLMEVQSPEVPEVAVRVKALRALCPCHAGWERFEQYMDIVERLKKDTSPVVRAIALHVFEDATEVQSSRCPTHPRKKAAIAVSTRRR